MLNLFLTGSNGFIGKNLKEQLSNKYNIYAPTSSELNLLDTERVVNYIRQNKFDIIVHTATWDATKTSDKDTSKVLYNNLKIFFNLARCNKYYEKMICYGSGAEYDKRNNLSKVKENFFDISQPVDDYGFSKYIISKYIEKTSQNIYNLRLFGVFGKYEDWRIRFISNCCCKVIFNLKIHIWQNMYFDYLYIDDLVKMTEWFIINTPQNKIYNVCTSNSYDLLTLAKKVCLVAGKDVSINLDKEEMSREYSGDNKKILNEIGKYEFKKIDDSIGKLYSWYVEHKKIINKNLCARINPDQ